MDYPRLSVIGLGKLGLPLAVAFASRGFQVTGIDIDPDVVAVVTTGKPRGYEPSLEEMLDAVRDNLQATTEYAAIYNTDVTFIIVATPSETDGGFSLKYIRSACKSLGSVLREKDTYHLVVISSTVMPQACEKEIIPLLETTSGKIAGVDFGVCCCPEWVALGKVLRDFLEPDFVLIGANDGRAALELEAVYRQFCTAPIIITSLVNAEIAKVALNCYLTTKITFANQLAQLCEHVPGADVDEVTTVLGADSRIDPKFLRGATPYGGHCFPRDTKAGQAMALRAGSLFPLIAHVENINNQGHLQLADKVMRAAFRFRDGRVGILGLSFKPDTDSVEASPAMILWERLEQHNYSVTGYDPQAKVSLPTTETAQKCVGVSDVIVIVTPWPEFADVRFYPNQIVIDCWRMLDRVDVEADGAKYIPVGMG